jgi:hypothetical protein
LSGVNAACVARTDNHVSKFEFRTARRCIGKARNGRMR